MTCAQRTWGLDARTSILLCFFAVLVSGCQSADLTGDAKQPTAGIAGNLTTQDLALRVAKTGSVPLADLLLSADEFGNRYSNELSAAAEQPSDYLMRSVNAVLTARPELSALGDDRTAAVASRLSLTFQQADIHSEMIRELLEAEARYLVLQDVREGKDTSAFVIGHLGLPYKASQLNKKEAALLLQYVTLAPGTYEAANDAEDWARDFGDSGDQKRGNALQHAAWNVLIVLHTASQFSSVQKANDWAKKFTDAHEYGDPKSRDSASEILASDMDLHNNAQGRRVVEEFFFKSCIILCQVKGPDKSTLKKLLASRANKAVKVKKSSEMAKYGTTMVYLK